MRRIRSMWCVPKGTQNHFCVIFNLSCRLMTPGILRSIRKVLPCKSCLCFENCSFIEDCSTSGRFVCLIYGIKYHTLASLGHSWGKADIKGSISVHVQYKISTPDKNWLQFKSIFHRSVASYHLSDTAPFAIQLLYPDLIGLVFGTRRQPSNNTGIYGITYMSST